MDGVKIILCLSFLVGLCYASLAKAPRRDHNLVDCDGDQSLNNLAMRKTIEEKGKLLQIRRGVLKFPEFSNSQKPITCVKVTDLMDDGKGGYPDILSGGVTFYNILLQFTSQRSKGYKFIVEIYTELP